jgi:phage terminase large subunit
LEQWKQQLENASGGGGSGLSAYIVNISIAEDGKVTADKTYADIYAAHSEGKIVQGRITERGLVGIMSACGTGQVLFIFQGNDVTSLIHCSSKNIWSSELYEVEYAQKTYVDNSIQSAILDSWAEVTEPIETGVSE